MLTPDDFDPYQTKTARQLIERSRVLLIADMGMGKTIIELTALRYLLANRRINNALIVAPKSVAISTWPNEINNWSHLSDLTLDLAQGSKPHMRDIIENGTAPITVIGMRNFRWLFETYFQKQGPRNKFWRWDSVTFDESAKIKDAGTQVSRAVKSMCDHIPRWVNMTADLAPEEYPNIWMQMRPIDKQALYPTVTDFRQRWCYQDIGSKKWKLRHHSCKSEILEKIAPHCIRLDAADHLPPQTIRTIDVPVHLTPELQQRYDEFEKERVLEFDDDEVMEVFDAGVHWGKKWQMANGSVIINKERDIVYEHDLKLQAFDALIESLHDKPVVVCVWFIEDRIRLMERYPDAVLFDSNKADAITKDWNAGKIKMLIGNPISFSHGLNWQDGGHYMIYYTTPYSSGVYHQAIGRLARRGQKYPVFVYRLIMMNTVDEVPNEVVTLKKEEDNDAKLWLKNYLMRKYPELVPTIGSASTPPAPAPLPLSSDAQPSTGSAPSPDALASLDQYFG